MQRLQLIHADVSGTFTLRQRVKTRLFTKFII